MTKDVEILVRGLQFGEAEDTEEIEVLQKGQYYNRNGTHYLIYEEPVEGTAATIKNTIKFKAGEAQVIKKGAIQTCLSFYENKKILTNYQTPYGVFLIGIDTSRIVIEESEETLRLQIEYKLDINEEFLADCRILVETKKDYR